MNKKKLLIVDDDEMNRRVISQFLKNDFEIIEAENGEQALSIINTIKIDAMLLDIIMPVMDGLEVLKILEKDIKNKDIAILVASSAKEQSERKALTLGADDVVSKPYDPIVIIKRLHNILMYKQLLKENKLLGNSDIEAAVENRMSTIMESNKEISHTILSLLSIIDENRENKKLYDELTKEIEQEAKKLTKNFY